MRKASFTKTAKKKTRAGYTRSQVAQLDKLARACVFARDGHKCQYGSTMMEDHLCAGRLEWAHVDSRRFRTTRWLPDNALVLCSKHHFMWHDRPVMMSEWWMRFFPDRKSTISRASAGRPLDFDLLKHGLSIYLKDLTAGTL